MKNRAMFGVIAALIAVCSVASAKIEEDDVVLYFPLDDGDGDIAADASGDWVKGKIGGGVAFDGAATFIEVLHHEDLNLTDGFTLAAWAQVDALPGSHIGIPRKEAAYVLHPTAAGASFNVRTYIQIAAAWEAPVISANIVAMGEWHHLAATYDGDTVSVWIDGEIDAKSSIPGPIVQNANNLRWANECCGNRFLDGTLDELAIFNRPLDPDEMSTLMTVGLTEALAIESKGKMATRWAELKR